MSVVYVCMSTIQNRSTNLINLHAAFSLPDLHNVDACRKCAKATEYPPGIHETPRDVPRGLAAFVKAEKDGVGFSVGRDYFHPWVIVARDSDLRRKATVRQAVNLYTV